MKLSFNPRLKLSEIQENWRVLKTNWLIGLSSKLIVITTLGSLIILVLVWQKLPPVVPLWFSQPWGEERLAYPAWLFVLPFSGLAFYLVNLILATYLTRDYPIFTRILFLTSLLISTLAFLALINIIFLVI